jgi:uncharacterized membrane protein
MDLARIARHMFTTAWSVRRAFPPHAMQAIERAIREAEAMHAGQIRFAVEHSLDLPELLRGVGARERAIDAFAHLRVWDTEHNNGVLIYLLLADHDVEIVADRGIHVKVGEGWEPICREMEAAFRAGRFEAGVLEGVRAVGAQLGAHFGRGARGANELPDLPVVL